MSTTTANHRPGLPRETDFALSPVAVRIRDLDGFDLPAGMVGEGFLLLGSDPAGAPAVLDVEDPSEDLRPLFSGTLAPMSAERVRAFSTGARRVDR